MAPYFKRRDTASSQIGIIGKGRGDRHLNPLHKEITCPSTMVCLKTDPKKRETGVGNSAE